MFHLSPNFSESFRNFDQAQRPTLYHDLLNFICAMRKKPKAIDEKFFKQLNFVKKGLHEIKPLRSTIEAKEPIIIRFFNRRYAILKRWTYTSIFSTSLAMRTNLRSWCWKRTLRI